VCSDQYIQQAKRKYGDRQRMAMTAVSGELQDVARLMVSNIEDVLHRGEALNSRALVSFSSEIITWWLLEIAHDMQIL